jgi:hypothetical protein
MRYEARVTAFDVMDQVHIALVVKCQQSVAEGHPMEVLALSCSIAGEGVDDAHHWVRDALVALLEYL